MSNQSVNLPSTKPILKVIFFLPELYRSLQGGGGYFEEVLSQHYQLIRADLVGCPPDVVFFNECARKKMPSYPGQPIYVSITGEVYPIDYQRCKFSFAFDEHRPECIYWPLWIYYTDWFRFDRPHLHYSALTVPKMFGLETLAQKKLFCGYLSRHPVPFRDSFVKKLSKCHRTVTCGGVIMNNYPKVQGTMGEHKLNFYRQCKFSICFEHTSSPGYITEKIVQGFQGETIPIYYGSPSVSKYFNPVAFLNYHSFKSEDDLIQEIIRLDQDDQAYLEMLNAPAFLNGKIPGQFTPDYIGQQLVQKINHHL